MLLSRRSLSLALTLFLTLSPLASAQNLSQGKQDPLGAYPGNTDALSVIDFRPQNIQAALQALPEDMRSELGASLQSLLLEMQREGMQGLLTALSQVAGHISIAYRKTPNRWGELLFQIETRHENTLKTALTSLQELSFQPESFGRYTLHTLTFDDNQDELAGLQLSLAQQGKYIRGSFGFDASGLKEMLYLDQVHPVKSPWRLSGQADIEQARQALSPQQQQWTYVRTSRLRELLRYVMDSEASLPDEKDPWTQDALSYIQGMGVGIDTQTLGQSALKIKGLTQHHKTNLSAYQQKMVKRDQKDQTYDFSGLLGRFPAPLTAFMAGHFHGLEDLKTIPSTHQMPASWKAFLEEDDIAEWQARLLETTGLNYAEDLAPYIAGPFALAWMPALPSSQTPTNPIGLALDLKPDKALAVHLAQTLIAGGHSPVEIKRLKEQAVYRLELPLTAEDMQEMNATLPGLMDESAGQNPAVYFVQQAATGSAPARLLLSNHLQALEQMMTQPSANHPYLQGDKPSQYHLYINTPLLAERIQMSPEEKQALVPLTDYLQSFYGTQTHSLEGITNDWVFNTTSRANPWLKLAETLPLPFTLVGAIVLPNFVGAQTRARKSSTKANMHTLQTLLETYAVDTGGEYPVSLEALEIEAKASGYWKDYSNPYDPSLPSYLSLEDYLSRSDKPQGVVIYEALGVSEGQFATGYRIYGANEQGLLLRIAADTDLPFTLTFTKEAPNTFLSPYLEPKPLIDTQKLSTALRNASEPPDYTPSRMHNKLTESNMYLYQTMVEIYRVELDGPLPESLEALEKHAKDNGYWSRFENPFDPNEPAVLLMEDYLSRSTKPRGVVLYQALEPANENETAYMIYGTDLDGAYIKEASSGNTLILQE